MTGIYHLKHATPIVSEGCVITECAIGVSFDDNGTALEAAWEYACKVFVELLLDGKTQLQVPVELIPAVAPGHTETLKMRWPVQAPRGSKLEARFGVAPNATLQHGAALDKLELHCYAPMVEDE